MQVLPKLTTMEFDAQLPAADSVMYKTIDTDETVWHNVRFKSRIRKYIGTFGNHRHYTMVDAKTGKNLVRRCRENYAKDLQAKAQAQGTPHAFNGNSQGYNR
jgi:hypothetical protein